MRRRGLERLATVAAVVVVTAACTPAGPASPSPTGTDGTGGTVAPSPSPRPSGPVTGVASTLRVGQEVFDVVVAADGTAYVSDSTAGTVSVIDPATRTVTATVSVGGRPTGMVLDRGTGYLYVAHAVEGDPPDHAVVIIDTGIEAVIGEIDVEPILSVHPALDAEAGELYVIRGEHAADVVVVATDSREVVAEIPVGEDTAGPVFDTDARRLYTSEYFLRTLTAVDLESRETTTSTPFDADFGLTPLAVEPGSGRVWVSEFEGPLDVVDGATLELVAQIDMGEGAESAVAGVVLDPGLGVAYVLKNRAGVVLVVDMESFEVLEEIDVGGSPTAAALDPVSGALYVLDRFAGEAYILEAGA